jgi:hypothetical protein
MEVGFQHKFGFRNGGGGVDSMIFLVFKGGSTLKMPSFDPNLA